MGDCASGRDVCCGMKVARVVVKVMARRSSVVSSWRAISCCDVLILWLVGWLIMMRMFRCRREAQSLSSRSSLLIQKSGFVKLNVVKESAVNGKSPIS